MKGRLLDAVPLSSLTGVGAALSNKLAKINLHTVQDLLLHLPLRYEDRTHLYPIGELLPGVYATVEGEVLNCNISFGGRRMMTCQISDGSGILTMRFFNFNAAMKNSGDRPPRAGLWRSKARQIWCGDDPPGIPRTGRSQHARVTGNAHAGLPNYGRRKAGYAA